MYLYKVGTHLSIPISEVYFRLFLFFSLETMLSIYFHFGQSPDSKTEHSSELSANRLWFNQAHSLMTIQ